MNLSVIKTLNFNLYTGSICSPIEKCPCLDSNGMEYEDGTVIVDDCIIK